MINPIVWISDIWLIFFIVHVDLTATGHTPMAHIMAMIRSDEDEPVQNHPHAQKAAATTGENV